MEFSCEELMEKYKEQKRTIADYLSFAFYKKYFSQFGLQYSKKNCCVDTDDGFYCYIEFYLNENIRVKCHFDLVMCDGKYEMCGSSNCLYIKFDETSDFWYDGKYNETHFVNIDEKHKPIIKYFEQDMDNIFSEMCDFIPTFYKKLYSTRYLHNLQCTYTFLIICKKFAIFPKDIYLLISRKILFFLFFVLKNKKLKGEKMKKKKMKKKKMKTR